jgi:hypothetical protein
MTIERQTTWWAGESGREVRKWFDAYGKVLRERVETGDPSAVPTMDGVAGSGRGNPGDLSSVVLLAAEVDAFLTRYATPRQRRLVDFVFAWGRTEIVTQVVYVLPDGTRSDPLQMDDPAPAGYVSAEASTRRAFDYDLDRFEAPEIDEVCKLWKTRKSIFLERELMRVAKLFAMVKGL